MGNVSLKCLNVHLQCHFNSTQNFLGKFAPIDSNFWANNTFEKPVRNSRSSNFRESAVHFFLLPSFSLIKFVCFNKCVQWRVKCIEKIHFCFYRWFSLFTHSMDFRYYCIFTLVVLVAVVQFSTSCHCYYCCRLCALFSFRFLFSFFVAAHVIFVICIPFTCERYVVVITFFSRHVNCKYSYFVRVSVCFVQLLLYQHYCYYYYHYFEIQLSLD